MTQQTNIDHTNQLLQIQRDTFKRIQKQTSIKSDISDIDEDTSLTMNSGGSGYIIVQNGRNIASSIPKSPMTPSLHAMHNNYEYRLNYKPQNRLFGGYLHKMKSKLKKKRQQRQRQRHNILLHELHDDDEYDDDSNADHELNTRMSSRAWTDYNNLLMGTHHFKFIRNWFSCLDTFYSLYWNMVFVLELLLVLHFRQMVLLQIHYEMMNKVKDLVLYML